MKLVEEIEKVEVQKQLQKIVSEFSRLSFLVLVHNISLIQFFCTERKTNTNRAEQILLSSESQNPTNNRVPKVLFPVHRCFERDRLYFYWFNLWFLNMSHVTPEFSGLEWSIASVRPWQGKIRIIVGYVGVWSRFCCCYDSPWYLVMFQLFLAL